MRRSVQVTAAALKTPTLSLLAPALTTLMVASTLWSGQATSFRSGSSLVVQSLFPSATEPLIPALSVNQSLASQVAATLTATFMTTPSSLI